VPIANTGYGPPDAGFSLNMGYQSNQQKKDETDYYVRY
jgi:hypothetical protein